MLHKATTGTARSLCAKVCHVLQCWTLIWALIREGWKNTKLYSLSLPHIEQGMVDGSASKPALRKNTGYMVEKTYHDIAPYLGAFGAYLMPQ